MNVDNYLGLAIPTSRHVLDHVGNGVMCGIHDVFPEGDTDEDDPVSLKKLHQQDGAWDTLKELLGFMFDGMNHTMWLAEGKCDALVATISDWLQASRKNKHFSFPFAEIHSVIY